jgi:multiple sugar transport system permease protein
MTMLQFLWLLLGSAQNVLLLTHGGPGSASMTLSFYLYNQAFEAGRVGYSQAIGVLLFAVGLAGMLVIRRAFRTSF